MHHVNSCENNKSYNIKIINIKDQIVHQQIISSNQFASIEHLNNGCYFVKVYDEIKYLFGHKLLIVK